MRKAKRIALILSATDAYSRRITEGLGRYAHSHEPWEFFLQVGRPHRASDITHLPVDGVIGNILDEGLADALVAAAIPTVSISNRRPHLPVPRVIVDDAAVADAAAEHLLDKGFRHFGYVGFREAPHCGSRLRGEAFRDAVEEQGGRCGFFRWRGQGRSRGTSEASIQGMAKWIAAMSKPAAVFAYTDDEAWPAAQACRRIGIRVPEEVAVLGVTNDPMVCSLATPPLSSVELPLEQLGYQAAGLLARLMDGLAPPDGPIVLPPMQVVARQSTDILAIEDVDIATAVRYIRDHADRAVRVGQVADAAMVSKRSLQRKFRLALGRTIQQEIRRSRIERAKRILLATDLAIPQVASRCGFAYAHHFDRVFRRETGATPTEFRSRFRIR